MRIIQLYVCIIYIVGAERVSELYSAGYIYAWWDNAQGTTDILEVLECLYNK